MLTRQISAIPRTKVANRLSFFLCFLWSRCFISKARKPSVSSSIKVSRLSFDFKILIFTPLVVLAAVTAKSRLYMLFSKDDLPVDCVPKIETICTFWYSSLLLKNFSDFSTQVFETYDDSNSCSKLMIISLFILVVSPSISSMDTPACTMSLKHRGISALSWKDARSVIVSATLFPIVDIYSWPSSRWKPTMSRPSICSQLN